MARKMFENLNAIVANTLTDSIKMIDIAELHESADNFFNICRVEELADTILGQGGVKDNLIVRPMETGGYEIISGHRRRAAVQHLINKGENISHFLPCLVQEYADENSKILDIILMNVSARQLTDSELWQSYEKIDTILKEKKNSGEKFGRIRETLSELLGVSPAQVGKMQNVEKYAIPEVKKAVANGDISINTANEVAKLDKEKQAELVSEDLSDLQHKDVKKIPKKANEKPTKKRNVQVENNSELEKVDIYINFKDFVTAHINEIEIILTKRISDKATDSERNIAKELWELIRSI